MGLTSYGCPKGEAPILLLDLMRSEVAELGGYGLSPQQRGLAVPSIFPPSPVTQPDSWGRGATVMCRHLQYMSSCQAETSTV